MRGNWMRGLAAAGLLIAAMVAIATPAGAVKDLVVTDYNKWYLANGGIWVPYGNGELLKWIGDGPRFSIRNSAYQKLRWIGNIPAVTTTDSYGSPNYWGECVSFVKLLSWSGVPTVAQYPGDKNHWTRGRKVMDGGVDQGTVIAKFNTDGTYDSRDGTGHAAIFDVYVQGQGPTGFRVWGENFVSSYLAVDISCILPPAAALQTPIIIMLCRCRK